MSDVDDPIDEYGPTHVLMEVPDLSGYNLPDLGLDSEPPPPRPAAGAPAPTPAAPHHHAAQGQHSPQPHMPAPPPSHPSAPQEDTTRALNPEEAAAVFGMEAPSSSRGPVPAAGAPMGGQPFASYGQPPTGGHASSPSGMGPGASPYGHLAQTTDLPGALPSSPHLMNAPPSTPGYAPPQSQPGYPPPHSQPGMQSHGQPGMPSHSQPGMQPHGQPGMQPHGQPGMRPPMMSMGGIEIPPQAPGMSDSTRLLLVFLGVGVVVAIAFAALAMLVGA